MINYTVLLNNTRKKITVFEKTVLDLKKAFYIVGELAHDYILHPGDHHKTVKTSFNGNKVIYYASREDFELIVFYHRDNAIIDMKFVDSKFHIDKIPKYDIFIVGCPGVGKTSFCQFLRMKTIRDKYFPTRDGGCSYFFNCDTNSGKYHLDVMDSTKSAADFEEIIYSEKKSGVIIMFSLNDESSYRDVKLYLKKVRKEDHNIPIVIVGTKSDLEKTVTNHDEDLAYYKKKKIGYYEISTKTGHNCQLPLTHLLRKIANKKNLEITDINEKIVVDPDIYLNISDEGDSDTEKVPDTDMKHFQEKSQTELHIIHYLCSKFTDFHYDSHELQKDIKRDTHFCIECDSFECVCDEVSTSDSD